MRCFTFALTLSTMILLSAAAPGREPDGALVNPGFRDADGNGVPDGWSGFPGGNGDTTRIEVTDDGVRLLDTDPSRGVGIEQWVRVEAGAEYQTEVETAGRGGAFVYMVFTPNIPAKAADVNRIKLGQKREWIRAGEAFQMRATAPAGTEFMKIWIYSPNDNAGCDLVVKRMRLADHGAETVQNAAAEVPDTAPAEERANALIQGMEGWAPFPGGNGDTTRIDPVEGGGVRLVDTDAAKGVGIEKWADASPGTRYVATVEAGGSGGAFLYMIFAREIPSRAGDLNAVKLSEQREWISTGEPLRMEATAPAGARKPKLWIYSPNDNTNCDLKVREVRLAEAGKAGAVPAAPPSAPEGATSYPHYNPSAILPEGEISAIDFETGDFSQVRSKEGGHKLVVSAPEPVRKGTYAMKVRMDHDHERSEITGLRSDAFGEYKYGWSLFIPKEFDAESSFSIVTQWHDWGSGRDYPGDGGPPTSLYIAGNTWRLKLRHQDGDQLKTAKREFTFGSIEPNRGKWTDFYLEVNWQSPQTNGGYFRLYKDGEQVIDYQGPTWYDGKVQGPYFKMGIYKGAGSWKGDSDRTYMYFDEFRMGDRSIPRDRIDPARL